jgi:hypothetical protein
MSETSSNFVLVVLCFGSLIGCAHWLSACELVIADDVLVFLRRLVG